MVDVGDVAVKIAGRDAGQVCVVVDVLDRNFVLVDGATRRRKCNLRHLEFLNKKVKIKKGVSSEEVRKALAELGLKLKEVKKGKTKERKEKPAKTRSSKKEENTVKKVKEKK